MNENEIVQFESNQIRRIWDEETKQWFFAVVDVIGVLTESKSPRHYWANMKRRDDGGEVLSNLQHFSMKNPKNKGTPQTARKSLIPLLLSLG